MSIAGLMVTSFVFAAVIAGVKVFAAFRESVRFAQEQELAYLQRKVERLTPQIGELRRSVMLHAGERVISPAVVKVKACSHWPRHQVLLSDGAVVAHICQRCGHSWPNEQWIATGL